MSTRRRPMLVAFKRLPTLILHLTVQRKITSRYQNALYIYKIIHNWDNINEMYPDTLFGNMVVLEAARNWQHWSQSGTLHHFLEACLWSDGEWLVHFVYRCKFVFCIIQQNVGISQSDITLQDDRDKAQLILITRYIWCSWACYGKPVESYFSWVKKFYAHPIKCNVQWNG